MPEARSWPHRGSRLSALMMLSPDRIAFVKPFFEVFITFFPSVPFRAGNRAPPPPEDVLCPVGPVDPARSSAWFSLVYALSVGSVKALPAVFSGALLAVFK